MTKDAASRYLNQLDEETMRRAWGEKSPKERRRIVSAALVFGEQFEEKMVQNPPGPAPDEQQRFLMSLFSDVVREFTRREGLDQAEATNFLSNVGTRDLILEFDEVLEAHAAAGPERTLDELLNEAVDSRREKAVWSQHFSSG